ncbi:hypothetical protein GDO86_020476, partial [Hymenochirus boettgeri]
NLPCRTLVLSFLKPSNEVLGDKRTLCLSLGSALNDSPAGLAAYILEKFSTWTNPEFRALEDGGLGRKYSMDDLLTNIMIYWLTGSITSSMRFYKENFARDFQSSPIVK